MKTTTVRMGTVPVLTFENTYHVTILRSQLFIFFFVMPSPTFGDLPGLTTPALVLLAAFLHCTLLPINIAALLTSV